MLAELEYEIAQKNIEAVRTRMISATPTCTISTMPRSKPANASSPFRMSPSNWSEARSRSCGLPEIWKTGLWAPNSGPMPLFARSLHQTLGSTTNLHKHCFSTTSTICRW